MSKREIMDAAYRERVDHFLKHDNIAIVGYSTKANAPANAVYERFKKNGFEVFAVNPFPENFPEMKVYSSVGNLPEIPGGVVIFTPPAETIKVLEECASIGAVNVWIHHSIDEGSWSPEAEQFARERNINLIPSGCPLMFLSPDIPHVCLKWLLNWRGLFKIDQKATGAATIS